MEKKNFLKFFVFFIIALLIINMVLLALNKTSEILFWIITATTAVFAYKILPKMRNQ